MESENLPLSAVQKLHIEMGYPCNLRCIMCFQGNFTQRMAPRIWKEALLPIYPHLQRVPIQGGEPTILKDCRELISLLLSFNPDVEFAMMTNGLMFDEYWRETFVDHGYEVNFSVNGASKAVHEAVNVRSDFERVMGNLTRLIRLREERGRKLAVYMSCVVLPENAHEIADFIELGHRLGTGVRFFCDASRVPPRSEAVERVVERGFELAHRYHEETPVVGLAMFYRHYCRHAGIENRLSHEQDFVPPKCRSPWRELNVDRLGRVKFCCMSNITLGDLNKNGIEEIWNGGRARLFRRRLAAGDFRYCQTECSLNTKPNFALDYLKADYFVRKFVAEFRASPDLAYRKAVRKIKQFI